MIIAEEKDHSKTVPHTCIQKVVDKVIEKNAGAQPGIFMSKGGFLEYGHLDKQFIHNIFFSLIFL